MNSYCVLNDLSVKSFVKYWDNFEMAYFATTNVNCF